MSTLTVEGKKFDLDALSDEAKAIASAVSFTDAKIKQVEQELMMARAARAHYVTELLKALPNTGSEAAAPATKAAPRKRSTSKTSTAKSAASKASSAKSTTAKSATTKTSPRSKATAK